MLDAKTNPLGSSLSTIASLVSVVAGLVLVSDTPLSDTVCQYVSVPTFVPPPSRSM